MTTDPNSNDHSAASDELAGKVALITGAGQGIGQGIALSLAKRGCRVVAVGRTLTKCEATIALIDEHYGVEGLAIGCDIGQLEALPGVVEQAVERFGRLDILVNNASIFAALQPKPFMQIDNDAGLLPGNGASSKISSVVMSVLTISNRVLTPSIRLVNG